MLCRRAKLLQSPTLGLAPSRVTGFIYCIVTENKLAFGLSALPEKSAMGLWHRKAQPAQKKSPLQAHEPNETCAALATSFALSAVAVGGYKSLIDPLSSTADWSITISRCRRPYPQANAQYLGKREIGLRCRQPNQKWVSFMGTGVDLQTGALQYLTRHPHCCSRPWFDTVIAAHKTFSSQLCRLRRANCATQR